MWQILAWVMPIQFAISETKIVDHVPQKDVEFATIIPGCPWTYVFSNDDSGGERMQFGGVPVRPGGVVSQ